jgi:hypothetical protein
MASNIRTGSKGGAGCLILFGLPFAAVGVGMCVWLGSTILNYFSARNWVETPARIVRTELKVSHGRKSNSYQATAEYTYDYGGQHYKGSRVGLTGGADNIGSFQQNAYRELSLYQQSGKLFRCFVNPARPDEALIYRDLRWEMLAFQLVFVLVFGGVGFGLLIGGVAAIRKERVRARLSAAHPESPWMWRADWAAGQIVATNKTLMLTSLSFAAFWNLVSAPLWFVLPGEIWQKHNYWALLGLLFPAIGIVLAAWAVFCVLRWLKYGQSIFQMADVPGRIGGQFAGVVRTSAKVRPEDGFHLALRCVRRITTGSGKSRSTTERILWEEQQTVMHELLDDDTAVSAIPVVFQVPADGQPSDDTDSNDQTVWRLVASAKVPGIDYSATFEVPVFRVEAET